MNEGSDHYKRIKDLLSPPTFPVAIRYFHEFDEDAEWELADHGFYRPRDPINLCQAVGLARHHGRMTLMKPEDMVCKIGSLSVGMYPFDETISSGEMGVRDGVRKTPELCREMFETLPRIEYGTVKAVAFAPLHKMNLETDQVIIYGDPLTILKLVQAYLWSKAPRLNLSTCGKYGVCAESMAASYNSGEPTLGFPCRGERTSAIVQSDELFICIPMEHLETVIEGLEKTKHLLPTPMPFSGVNQSPILPENYLTEHAKERR